MKSAYGIVVPVRNEAAVLPRTVPRLLAATKGQPARIIWVCNGCSDNSPGIIRRLAGPAAEVIELTHPGKTAALQAGDDAMGGLYPRLYLDADTWMNPGDLAHLMQPLFSGVADLVAPRLRFDITGASPLSARIGACWMSLPHAQTTAFSNAIGLSAAARGLWDRWPEITGDDIFISATVPSGRKLIVHEASATIGMPRTFAGWVRMRARWLKGEAELAHLGLSPPRPDRQRSDLLHQMLRPGTAPGAWAFVAARLLARTARTDAGLSTWVPDRAVDTGNA
ncbi:glycosyltransferase family 2 protein [Antarctobacter jejuensis]|uniref:glycosyltransferase family 2 protein n=1 Tax=Antarctobacter jejuensis TaxID=1439938 RepID=UPI003FD1E111